MWTSGRTAPLAKPNLHRAGPGVRIKKKKKQNIKGRAKGSLSLPRPGALFSLSLWVNTPSRLKDGFSCYYLIKTEL